MVILPPDSPRAYGPSGPSGYRGEGDVGAFAQGDELSRWALGRYLLGRALAVQVSRALLVVALLIAAGAVGLYVGGFTVLAVLVGLVAVAVLGARAILMAVLRHTMPSVASDGQHRLDALVADTRKDVGRELRRLGLPSRTLTLPLLGFRLAGRRRGAVLARLREFDVERVVPPARLDEVHLLLGSSARRGGPLR